jgi:hypothetical protein
MEIETAEELLQALKTFEKGDFLVQVKPRKLGLEKEIADTFNRVTQKHYSMLQVGHALSKNFSHLF